MKYLSFSYVCHYIYIYTCIHIYIYIYMHIYIYQIYVTVANYLYHKLLVLLAQLSGYSQVTPWVGSLTAHVISIYQLIWRASTKTLLLQNPYRTSGSLMSSGWLGWGSPRSEKQMGALPIQAWGVLWLGIDRTLCMSHCLFTFNFFVLNIPWPSSKHLSVWIARYCHIYIYIY